MKNKNIDKIFTFVIILIVLTTSLISLIISNLPYSTPDESISNIFSKNLLEKNSLNYNNSELIENTENLSATTLIPRGTFLMKGNIIPLQFPGWLYFLSSMYMVSYNLSNILVPLIYVLSITIVYLFLKYLFKNNNLKIGFLIFLVLPTTLLWASMLFNNLLTSSLFIFGLFYFFKFLNYKKYNLIIISAIFLFSSTWYRYEFYLFILPILISLIILEFKNHFNFRYTLIFLGIGGIFLISSLLYNQIYFGSFLNTPYTIKSTTTYGGAFNLFPKMTFAISTVFYNLYNNIIGVLPGLFFFSFVGIITLLNILKNKKYFKNNNLILIIFISLIMILFYGTNIFFGYSKSLNPILFSSYSRYWIFIFFFLVVFFIYFLKEVNLNKKIKLIILPILLILIIFPSFNIDSKGLLYIYESKEKNKEFVNWTLHNIEKNNSVILSIHADEKLFPDRVTGTLDPSFVSYYFPNVSNINKETLIKMQVSDIIKLNKKYNVFLIKDEESLDINSFNNYLNKGGLTLKNLYSPYYETYQIVKNETSD